MRRNSFGPTSECTKAIERAGSTQSASNVNDMRHGRGKPSRRGLFVAVVAVMSSLLTGVGTTAMASSGMETPWGWVADNVLALDGPNGTYCFQGILVHWTGVDSEADIVIDAKNIVAAVDLTNLPTAAAEARLAKEYAEATDAVGRPHPVEMSAQELRQAAIPIVLWELLSEELQSRGYSQTEVSAIGLSGSATGCA